MLVDSHCHILPGLDDGPSAWSDSLDMARIAVESGTSTLIATPHQFADTCLMPSTDLSMTGLPSTGGTLAAGATCEAIRQTTQAFQARLDEASIPLRVLPGAELRVGEGLLEHVATDRLMTLADRGRYLLLELPHEIYIPIDRVVEEAR